MNLNSILASTQSEIRDRFPDYESLEDTPPWVGDVRAVAADSKAQIVGVPIPSGAEFPWSSSPLFEEISPDQIRAVSQRGRDGLPAANQPSVLAWYETFRSHRPWGIYIRHAGVEHLAKNLNSGLTDPALAREIAYKALVEHELMHYCVDLSVGAIEIVADRSLKAPWSRRLRLGLGYSLIEEGICSASMRRVVPRTAKAALDTWLDACPVGYDEYKQHGTSLDGRAQSWSSLFAEIADETTLRISPLVERFSTSTRSVPVYLVYETRFLRSANEPSWSFSGPQSVSIAPEFDRALKKTGIPNILNARVKKIVSQISSGAHTPGLRVEFYSQGTYTVRVNKQTRIVLGYEPGHVTFLDISQQHDKINSRAARS